MEIEFSPEPSGEERRALLEGLEQLLRQEGMRPLPAAYQSAWRQAGILDAMEDQAAVARPRSSFGAIRA
ncbi:MAG TPA: hypothetical protein VF895_01665 [Gaiellaceae bacterium]